MKRMLIKIVLVLLVVYISGYLSLEYSNYVSSFYKYSIAIDLLLRIVPGFLCGLILGYESIVQYIRIKSGRFDIRYVLLSLLLVGLAVYPFLVFIFPITVHRSVLQIDKILMTYTLGVMSSFLAGYCLTQSFSTKR
ncbi:MAG: hypothetical protein E4G74_02065 [Erysipelotrichales bacterium]|nr:MAG: hypothetical protein E4G74_02065 [Erysipelotrichales bacterium]